MFEACWLKSQEFSKQWYCYDNPSSESKIRRCYYRNLGLNGILLRQHKHGFIYKRITMVEGFSVHNGISLLNHSIQLARSSITTWSKNSSIYSSYNRYSTDPLSRTLYESTQHCSKYYRFKTPATTTSNLVSIKQILRNSCRTF